MCCATDFITSWRRAFIRVRSPEFLVYAQEEQEHADRIAARIRQLGGKPEMDPAVVAQSSHTEYKEGTSLADMLREDLVAERIAVATYAKSLNILVRTIRPHARC